MIVDTLWDRTALYIFGKLHLQNSILSTTRMIYKMLFRYVISHDTAFDSIYVCLFVCLCVCVHVFFYFILFFDWGSKVLIATNRFRLPQGLKFIKSCRIGGLQNCL